MSRWLGLQNRKGFLRGKKKLLTLDAAKLSLAKPMWSLGSQVHYFEENAASTQRAEGGLFQEEFKEAKRWRDILRSLWMCGAAVYKETGVPENSAVGENKTGRKKNQPIGHAKQNWK